VLVESVVHGKSEVSDVVIRRMLELEAQIADMRQSKWESQKVRTAVPNTRFIRNMVLSTLFSNQEHQKKEFSLVKKAKADRLRRFLQSQKDVAEAAKKYKKRMREELYDSDDDKRRHNKRLKLNHNGSHHRRNRRSRSRSPSTSGSESSSESNHHKRYTDDSSSDSTSDSSSPDRRRRNYRTNHRSIRKRRSKHKSTRRRRTQHYHKEHSSEKHHRKSDNTFRDWNQEKQIIISPYSKTTTTSDYEEFRQRLNRDEEEKVTMLRIKYMKVRGRGSVGSRMDKDCGFDPATVVSNTQEQMQLQVKEPLMKPNRSVFISSESSESESSEESSESESESTVEEKRRYISRNSKKHSKRTEKKKSKRNKEKRSKRREKHKKRNKSCN